MEAETRYQTREKQARIRLLGQANARLDQANARQRRLLWALAAGVLLLAGLLTVVLRQRRQLRQANALLVSTNQTVSEQAQRLATLLHELHHRVKNNLATVASLLRLQSNRLTKPSARQAVQESRQRVEAMSLIHQRLYQTAEVSTVDMYAYLTDLLDSLLRAYGYAPHQLAVTLDVPLGLLVNELVTNALKHAYAHVPHPSLRVALCHSPAAGLTLEVADNGSEFDTAAVPARESFGRRLIAVLSEELNGEDSWINAAGTCFRLHIPAG